MITKIINLYDEEENDSTYIELTLDVEKESEFENIVEIIIEDATEEWREESPDCLINIIEEKIKQNDKVKSFKYIEVKKFNI